MAELPEVETIRRQLERDVVGRKVKAVEVHDTMAIPRHSNKKQFGQMLEGAKLKSLMRRGTFLIFTLDTEDRFIVRPGAGGGLRRAAGKGAPGPGTSVFITFT